MVGPGGTLRLVFFGTPDFAVPTLEALLDSRHDVAGVVTQPDRPRGRGQRVSDSPVKRVALSRGVPVLQPDRLKDESFLAGLRAWHADAGVVAAYGKILPAAVLEAPPLGLLNVHASLLPRHRGAAPVHRAVIAGDGETGVSIMRVVQALDAGGVFATARRPIGPDDTSAEVEHDLARLGASLLLAVLDQLADGRAHRDAAGRQRGDLRPPPAQGRRPRRLAGAGRRDSQPGARAAAVADGVDLHRRTPAHPRPHADRAGVAGQRARARFDRADR